MTPQEIDAVIGGNVRKHRTLRGITQEQLADACNVSFQQIQKYENGKNRMGGSRLVQIANALTCTMNDLFDGTPTGSPNPSSIPELLQIPIAAIEKLGSTRGMTVLAIPDKFAEGL